MRLRTQVVFLSWLAAATAGVGACRESPLTPSDPANIVRIVDPAGALGDASAIRTLVTSTLGRVTERLPISGVTITVTPDPARAIGGYGAGGFTPDARTVSIYIDPAFPNIGGLAADRVPILVAHELHHAKRWKGPGYGRTLLEAMISEGLADHFAMELLGVAAPPWTNAFPAEDTARYLSLAQPEFDATTYDHAAWFFNASPTRPRWTGYTLGFRLVESYLTSHAGASATSLVNAPASAFR